MNSKQAASKVAEELGRNVDSPGTSRLAADLERTSTVTTKRAGSRYETTHPKDAPSITGKFHYGVTTPDGGLLSCTSPADAGRVCDLLNELTDSNADLVDACKAALTQFEYMLELMGDGMMGEFYVGADSECLTSAETIRAAIAKATNGGGEA